MVRFKNRYLLMELRWEDGKVDQSLEWYTLLRAIKDSVALNFGDFGLGCVLSSLQVKYWNSLTNTCIVRSPRDHHEMVQAACTLLTSVKGRTVALDTVYVAGTIRKCQEKAIQYNKKALQLLKASTQAPTRLKRKAGEMLAAGADHERLSSLDT